MRLSRELLIALALAVAAAPLAAQAGSPLMRGLQLEEQGRYADAANAFREAMAGGELAPALLGLERVVAIAGRLHTIVPLLDSLAAQRPRDPTIRTVQLRTVTTLGRDADARRVFEEWRRAAPREPAPYREYARLLLQAQRAAAVDSVLRLAERELGGGTSLSYELAQLRVLLGQWGPAAVAWRAAVAEAPFLEQAAAYALLRAPAESRDTVRQVLDAPPVVVPVRRLLASLELGWGASRAAWAALRTLPKSPESAQAWIEFAQRSEEAGAYLAARDALVAALDVRFDAEIAVRAAADALRGGDAPSALTLARRARERLPSDRAARSVLPIEVRALATLGRPAEAARLADSEGGRLAPDQRRALAREVAWGWVRTGDVARARAALADAAGGDEESDAAAGWLALYEGDLATARRALTSAPEASVEGIAAAALLTRTRAERAPVVGRAFLALARGDTAEAAADFAEAANELPDAAPLLLASAARLLGDRNADRAVELWRTVATSHAASPEAPEANLEWARVLRRRGDRQGAIERLEHLILEYPGSALVPQARRELELARRSIPSTS